MDDQLQAGPAPASPAGWDADPYGRHELRYWDGAGWTEHIADGGTTGVDAVEVPSPWALIHQAAAPAATPTPVATPPPVARPTPVATPTPAATPSPVAAPPVATTPATAAWNAPDPVPVPVPMWGPPSQPPPGVEPGSFDRPASIPWYKRPLGRALAIFGAVFVVLLGIALVSFRPAERIDAQPPAPTPAGFQLVSVDEYQYAVPGSWRTDVLDDNAIDRLADRVDQGAPGAGDAIRDASGEIEGTQSVAVDMANGDNANVIPYRALDGDPTDADTLAEIEQSFREGEAGVVPDTVSASPGDVHGFPAAVLRITANVNGATINLVSTIIQTGDRVFQLTVSSPSAPRAETLSSQIVPTFSPH